MARILTDRDGGTGAQRFVCGTRKKAQDGSERRPVDEEEEPSNVAADANRLGDPRNLTCGTAAGEQPHASFVTGQRERAVHTVLRERVQDILRACAKKYEDSAKSYRRTIRHGAATCALATCYNADAIKEIRGDFGKWTIVISTGDRSVARISCTVPCYSAGDFQT